MNRPESHEVFRRWRRICEDYDPPRLLVGETLCARPGRDGLVLRRRRRAPARLQLRLSSTRRSRPSACAGSSSRPRRPCPRAAGRSGRCPTTTSSASRPAGRTATRPRSAARSWCCCCCAGRPFSTTATRSGSSTQDVPRERELDFAGHRDGARTPMRWSGEPGHGFSADGVEPWLPFGSGPDMASQRTIPIPR